MISLNWVKDYIDLKDQDLKELATKITKAGINIEAVITNHIDNLVIGEVISCEDHPDSDHLHVCKVKVSSDEVLQIVCGAPNVRSGLKVIVALVGAVLPGDFEIKKGLIRGVESNGMLCALFELGLEEKTDENYAKGICELGDDAIVGTDPLEYLGLDDTLYDLDVHKHRNNDCYYHIGFAHEIGTVLGRKVNYPQVSYNEVSDRVEDYITLDVETSKCSYYLGKMVRNVKIGKSPEWMVKRLQAAGMRSINNVVDISNYVMLEYGQPTHFFDADKLGKKILVRDAFSEEKMVTLDGEMRNLSINDIVITDGKNPVCIAGVMGGENVEVDENTKNIFIEAAIFDAFSITKTSSRLNLKSEASKRYGKGLNYEYTDMAMDRCCALLEEFAGGEVLSGCLKHDKEDKTLKKVLVSVSELNSVLGLEMTLDDVKEELRKLDFPYELVDGKFDITIPRRRLDVMPNKADIAEEIGRLYGYNNLEDTLPKVSTKRGVYVGDVLIRKQTSKRLRSLGLNEVRTYTLVSKELANKFNYNNLELLELPNPLSSDKAVVRSSIIESLIQTYEYNKARKVNNVKIYEISKIYDKNFVEDTRVAMLVEGNYIESKWNNNVIKADFYVLKGLVENLLYYLGFKNRYSFEADVICDMHPSIGAKILVDREPIGVIGRVHPKRCKDDVFVCELSLTALYNKSVKPIKFKEASKYPQIVKDAAFIVDNGVSNADIMSVIKCAGGRVLDSVDIFDIYKDIEPGKKSMAYTMVFKDESRTLSLDEVTLVFNKIIDEVCNKCNAVLRDK